MFCVCFLCFGLMCFSCLLFLDFLVGASACEGNCPRWRSELAAPAVALPQWVGARFLHLPDDPPERVRGIDNRPGWGFWRIGRRCSSGKPASPVSICPTGLFGAFPGRPGVAARGLPGIRISFFFIIIFLTGVGAFRRGRRMARHGWRSAGRTGIGLSRKRACLTPRIGATQAPLPL